MNTTTITTNAATSSARDIETLADSLSACADELHVRIMKALRSNPPGGPVRDADGAAPEGAPASLENGISHGAAQALFENEVALRQRANGLYVDAALLAGAGLGSAQQDMLYLVATARRRIRNASMLKDVIALTADMLGLAAAIAAARPEHLPAAVESIKQHLAQLMDDRAA
jgi:hypothetical protein